MPDAGLRKLYDYTMSARTEILSYFPLAGQLAGGTPQKQGPTYRLKKLQGDANRRCRLSFLCYQLWT
jgi:hypothetical protein